MWLGYTLPLSKQCKYFVITFKAGSKITADINVITEKFFVDHNILSDEMHHFESKNLHRFICLQ